MINTLCIIKCENIMTNNKFLVATFVSEFVQQSITVQMLEKMIP